MHKVMRNKYTILSTKTKGKRPFGVPRRNWKDDMIDLKEIGCEHADWIHLAPNMVQWRVLVNIPSGSIKGGELLTSGEQLPASDGVLGYFYDQT
jgi:hypothetical protein